MYRNGKMKQGVQSSCEEQIQIPTVKLNVIRKSKLILSKPLTPQNQSQQAFAQEQVMKNTEHVEESAKPMVFVLLGFSSNFACYISFVLVLFVCFLFVCLFVFSFIVASFISCCLIRVILYLLETLTSFPLFYQLTLVGSVVHDLFPLIPFNLKRR